VNNIRIALTLFALLAFSGSWAAVSDIAGPVDGGRTTTNPSNCAMALVISLSPGYEIGSDYVVFVYDVHNTGTSKLCNVVINSSLLGMAPLDPFDLEPDGNSTLTLEYHITAEDRESPYLVNEATAEAHSCETGQVTTTASASCSVVLINPS
jgi:hypothetical protein